ncbi:MAG: hypothetical protein WCG34_00030 [Leptolinea sp.]
MKKIIFTTLFAFIIVSCNFLASQSPELKDNISTEVSQQLTTAPIELITATEIPATEDSNAATPSPQDPPPTATESPTPTITMTPTLSPDDPRIKLGAPDWKEDFSKANNNFYQYEDAQSRFVYDSGALALTAKNPNGWTGWSLSYPKPKNFYLEATFKVETCSGLDRYGLVYRAPNFENGYFFGLSCDGQFLLRIYNQQGTLIPWTPNPAILQGSNQVNRLGILAQGDRYAFYANGKLLQETKESTFIEAGLFGAFIASSNTSNFTVRMDEIAFWNK